MSLLTNRQVALDTFDNWIWQVPTSTVSKIIETDLDVEYRFYRINEIIEEKAAVHRLAMSNVISSMNNANAALVYLISSSDQGVSFYIGVAGKTTSIEVSDTAKMLEQSFSGNLLGAKLQRIDSDSLELIELLKDTPRMGFVSGLPSFNEAEGQLGDKEFQGIERLINGLAGERWRMIIVAEPGSADEVQQIMREIYNYSTLVSAEIKHSIQHSENTSIQRSKTQGLTTSVAEGSNKNETTGTSDSRGKSTNIGQTNGENSGSGSSSTNKSYQNGSGTSESFTKNTSISEGVNKSVTQGKNTAETLGENEGHGFALTQESTNKQYEELLRHLNETQLPRFRLGYSKGMFRTAIYLCAANNALYERLSHSVLSIFQGNQANMLPLRAHKISNTNHIVALPQLLQIHESSKGLSKEAGSFYSISSNRVDKQLQNATWLNCEELALLAGLPGKELPGIKIRKSINFALNAPIVEKSEERLPLGHVVQHGKLLKFKPLHLNRSELNKHIFISGVTGSGKTTTCMKLLLESQLPFLVIEPAKTEYRALYQHVKDIRYYTLGREDITPFRLNPFELTSPHENLTSHIDILKNTLNAVFPMEASMPYMVEEAIIAAYKSKGWDIYTSQNYLFDNPFDEGGKVWPNFSDMIFELKEVITSKKLGQEFTEKYLGSLVSRLSNLTKGTKGKMLNCRESINFDALLDQKVVFELEEIKDEGDKALFMALVISRLAECIKQRHNRDPSYQHITLIEEAHRLLSKHDPAEGGSKKLGVTMFCNLLSEVRKYGEGLIIADQIPSKLVSDVIKNTNIKIVHRLFSAEDREIIGDTMSLSDEQKEHLPALELGQAVVYGGGWHAAVLVNVERNINTTDKPLSETVIREAGLRVIWDERYRLYNNLASTDIFENSDELIKFQKIAAQFTALAFQLLPIIYLESNNDIEKKTLLVKRITIIFDKLKADFSFSQEILENALVAYVFDETLIPKKESYVSSLFSLFRFCFSNCSLKESDLNNVKRDFKFWANSGWI